MKTHELKTWPDSFQAIVLGLKTAEVRIDDGRNFAAGDVLELLEWEPNREEGETDHESGEYTGRQIIAFVRHLENLTGYDVVGLSAATRAAPLWTQKPHVVCMSLELMEISE